MAYTFKHGDQPFDGVTIQRAVGRGGFGEVYYAVTDSGKEIAIKYLRENPEVELRGIAQVMNLKSPHLLTIYDVKKNAENEPFVVMEYIAGPSLRELMMAEPNGFPVGKATFFFHGIARGLAYLHERGIVHRDLKPANIFFDDGYVKIGDYGLSKHMSVSKHSGQTVSVGTVHYMAPEIGSGSYTKAIDVYALGVILFEMLTGRLPFSGSSMAEILMRHLSDRPDVSGLPEPFARVVAKSLAKDPRDRYQDVQEMLADVMSSAVVSEQFRGFDPLSLSQVPRAIGAVDLAETMTRGGNAPLPPLPRPVAPVMDVRDAAFGAMPPKLQDRLRARARDIEARIEDKLSKLAGQPVKLKTPIAPQIPTEKRLKRIPHLLMLAGVAIAASVAFGFVRYPRSPEEVAAPTAMMLILGTFAVMGTYFWGILRMPQQSGVMSRIALAGLTFLCMGPAIALAMEARGFHRDDSLFDNRLAAAMMGPIAALLICDFVRRIESGRRGRVTVGDAVMPFIFGCAGGGIAGADGLVPFGGVFAAGLTLLVQSTATLWPFPARREDQLDGRFVGYAPAGEGWKPVAPMPVAAVATPRDAIAYGDPAAGVAAPPQSPAREASAAAAPSPSRSSSIVTSDEPSIIERMINFCLAFSGVTLLLGGLLCAVTFSTLQVQARSALEANSNGTIMVNGRAVEASKFELPKPVVLIPMLAGAVMVLISRRQSTAGHFVRGVFGSAACVGAGLLSIGPAQAGWTELLSRNDWNRLTMGDAGPAPLVASCVLTLFALSMIFWPRRRSVSTVVV